MPQTSVCGKSRAALPLHRGRRELVTPVLRREFACVNRGMWERKLNTRGSRLGQKSEAMMRYAVILSAVLIGAWVGMGSGGASKPRPHLSTNPCTLDKGQCYSIQGQSPTADQCVPPLVAYYVGYEPETFFLECMRGRDNE